MTAVEATSVTEEEQSKPLALRVGAELVGSFIICFAIYSICTLGSAIYGVNMAFIALLTGLVYAAATLIFGTISGAQFNPAVSVAAMLSGKTHVLDGVLYIIAQVLGGIGAGAAIRFLLPTSEQVTLKIWLTPVINGFDKNSVSYATLGNYGVSFSITLAIAVELVAGIIIVATALNTTSESGNRRRSESGSCHWHRHLRPESGPFPRASAAAMGVLDLPDSRSRHRLACGHSRVHDRHQEKRFGSRAGFRNAGDHSRRRVRRCRRARGRAG